MITLHASLVLFQYGIVCQIMPFLQKLLTALKTRDTCRFRVLIGNNGAMYFNVYPEPYNHAHSLHVYFWYNPVGLKSDGTTGQTTGHLEVDMPWYAVVVYVIYLVWPHGNRTLRTQDTSVPRHFGSSAEVSRRHFGTGAEVSGQFGTKTLRHQDISALVSGHFGTNAWTLRHYSRTPLRQCADLQ